jgi:hypothetical protein
MAWHQVWGAGAHGEAGLRSTLHALRSCIEYAAARTQLSCRDPHAGCGAQVAISSTLLDREHSGTVYHRSHGQCYPMQGMQTLCIRLIQDCCCFNVKDTWQQCCTSEPTLATATTQQHAVIRGACHMWPDAHAPQIHCGTPAASRPTKALDNPTPHTQMHTHCSHAQSHGSPQLMLHRKQWPCSSDQTGKPVTSSHKPQAAVMLRTATAKGRHCHDGHTVPPMPTQATSAAHTGVEVAAAHAGGYKSTRCWENCERLACMVAASLHRSHCTLDKKTQAAAGASSETRRYTHAHDTWRQLQGGCRHRLMFLDAQHPGRHQQPCSIPRTQHTAAVMGTPARQCPSQTTHQPDCAAAAVLACTRLLS